jgi:hypothetical protein
MAACLALIGADIHRRVAAGKDDVFLDSVIPGLAEELVALYDGIDWLEDYDPQDIWDAAWRVDLLTFSHDEWGSDWLVLLDFGPRHHFIGFVTSAGHRPGLEIVAEVDPGDDDAVRAIISEFASWGLGAGEYMGRTPDSISFEPPVTGGDIRSVTVGKFMALEGVAEEYAEWMEEHRQGTWPVATETDRAALADAYLEVVLGHSPTQYPLEIDTDEGGGMLLSELLESGQADLDRIEDELGRLRAEMDNHPPDGSPGD